jgi:hypothetical protein
MLAPADVQFYRDRGYLVVPDVLDARILGVMRAEMARILEGARAVTTHTDRYDLELGHRPDDPRVRRVHENQLDAGRRYFPVTDGPTPISRT